MTAPESVQVVPVKKSRSPLGLPRGSVRALLTLMIVLVVCTEVLRGNKPDVLWTETLMIALAHYFTSRRFVNLSPDLARRLEEDGSLPSEPHPLFLPRLSIRLIIIAAFVGVGAWVYHVGRQLRDPEVATLGLIGAYLAGTIGGSLTRWWNRGQPSRLGQVWNDLKALATLICVPITAAATLFDHTNLLPTWFNDVSLGLALFYFGSR